MWLLIVMTILGEDPSITAVDTHGATIAMHEFKSKEDCEKASEAIYGMQFGKLPQVSAGGLKRNASWRITNACIQLNGK